MASDETLKELMETTQCLNELQKRREKRRQMMNSGLNLSVTPSIQAFKPPPTKKPATTANASSSSLAATPSNTVSIAQKPANSTESVLDNSSINGSVPMTDHKSVVKVTTMPLAHMEKEILSILEALVLAEDHRISVANIMKDLQRRAAPKSETPLEADLQNTLQKLAFLKVILVTRKPDDNEIVTITDVNHDKLGAHFGRDLPQDTNSTKQSEILDDDIENLLQAQSAQEREKIAFTEEIMSLLDQPTAMDMSKFESFRSHKGNQAVRRFCRFGTRAECKRRNVNTTCNFLHFYKIIQPHTDESLGDCSFLNTCFHMDTCKYVHYDVEKSELESAAGSHSDGQSHQETTVHRHLKPTKMFPPQWICCDLRRFDFQILGKFSVIMADPPWDIHMELPYGTMSDDEMRKLEIPCLQDEGYIFLWVTGRAMELGRQCLRLWGYKRVDEIIWVKTNQLQRLIRTGRTGHWLNHGKEHCLVGVKGNPQGVNKGLDCDVIVSEVRETSHKPDEIYGIIERLSPGTRKLELFGRPHNVQPNWITLGNQLEGTQLVDPEVVERFRAAYPKGLDTS